MRPGGSESSPRRGWIWKTSVAAKVNIVVTELPYAVQKSTVLERIAREVRDGKISGVTDLRDESDHEGMRAVIEVSRMADAREVLESVLSRSQLRETFGVNALALVSEKSQRRHNCAPAAALATRMLVHFVDHRLNVIVRRSRYELAKREARLHIVEGLLKALDIIDEVIDTIRRSRTTETAEANLIKKFKFTELQAQAILAMQLRRLAASGAAQAGRRGKGTQGPHQVSQGPAAFASAPSGSGG